MPVSRRSYPGLADGRYVFQLLGTSSAGVPGTPTQATFVVDTTPPSYQITFMPQCAFAAKTWLLLLYIHESS